MPPLVLILMVMLAGAAIAAVTCALRAATARRAARVAGRLARSRRRALGLFAAEVQAPGLALLGIAEALPEPQRDAVAAEARRLLRIAAAVAEHQAAEGAPRRLDTESIPLLPLLEETVAATAAQLGPGRRQWRIAPDFARWTVTADRRALRGALLPVLARAARTSRDGDWIDLKPMVAADSLAIIVEDEGAGLGADDLAGAVAAGTDPIGHTRGLDYGLAVARSLLEAHGGGLRLEALAGVGARAWLTLPRDRVLAG